MIIKTCGYGQINEINDKQSLFASAINKVTKFFNSVFNRISTLGTSLVRAFSSVKCNNGCLLR